MQEEVKIVLQLDEKEALKPQPQTNHPIKVPEVEMTFLSDQSLLGDLNV